MQIEGGCTQLSLIGIIFLSVSVFPLFLWILNVALCLMVFLHHTSSQYSMPQLHLHSSLYHIFCSKIVRDILSYPLYRILDICSIYCLSSSNFIVKEICGGVKNVYIFGFLGWATSPL